MSIVFEATVEGNDVRNGFSGLETTVEKRGVSIVAGAIARQPGFAARCCKGRKPAVGARARRDRESAVCAAWLQPGFIRGTSDIATMVAEGKGSVAAMIILGKLNDEKLLNLEGREGA